MSVCLSEIGVKEDIASNIIVYMDKFELVIVMHSKSYPMQPVFEFSTYGELIYRQVKGYFSIKMCDKFEVAEARYTDDHYSKSFLMYMFYLIIYYVHTYHFEFIFY